MASGFMASFAFPRTPLARLAALRNASRSASCLFLTAILCACGQGGAGSAPNPAALAVPAKVLQIAPQQVPIVIEAVGQVQGSKEVEVRARVTGILLKRLFSEGSLVRAQAPLFQIDPAPYEIALSQARAQLAQESARLEQTRREATRLKSLVEERAISQKEFDDATSALKLSEATSQGAEANVRQAELNLSYTLVTAPVSGVTGRMLRSEGSLIAAGQESSLLAAINQIQPIWVRFSLSESDFARIPGGKLKRGTSAEVRLTLPDGTPYPEKGRVNFAATQIDPRLATQELRAEFDNPRLQLLPGQFVRVKILAGELENAFLVPQTAVIQTERGRFVFVVDAESKAAIRPVQTGEWVGSDWLILSGLNAGDRVVLDNLLKLRPGAPVNPQSPADPGAAGAKAAAAK
jgi:membrane fusion protein (multidrug efflux system)